MESKVAQFIIETGITAKIEELKMEFKSTHKIFSDVSDDEGNQYVDLVQQGGGVWGVSLLGFVYVLEEVGIRFFSLAGTSAGAINAMAMAAIKDKNEAKAKDILELTLNLDMDKLMDGKSDNNFTSWERRTIKHFIKFPWFGNAILYTIVAIIGILFLSSVVSIILCFCNSSCYLPINIVILFFWVIVLFLGVLTYIRLNQVKNGFGLNKGDYFHQWVTKEILKGKNLDDLKTHFSKVPKGLYLNYKATHRNKKEIHPRVPRLAFITADITTQNKIEFPRMWKMYYPKLESINPADFVRASMSIPIFFEAYKMKPIKPFEANSWNELLSWENRPIPDEVFFVDGGSLSNFPINIFYNPKNEAPRLPTFGIRLVEKKYKNEFVIKSLTELAGKIINTMKLSSDKEFINKNQSYNQGIAYVEIGKELSWLNFYMNNKQKQELFIKGAETAIQFLKDFDWEKYKNERVEEKNRQIDTQTYNPNNW